jgi:hypothetical protein
MSPYFAMIYTIRLCSNEPAVEKNNQQASQPADFVI